MASRVAPQQDGDKFWRMPECYIRGSTIKYLRIPDEIIDMVKEEVVSKGRGRGGMQQQKQQKGRGVGGAGRGKNPGVFFPSLENGGSGIPAFKISPLVQGTAPAALFQTQGCVWGKLEPLLCRIQSSECVRRPLPRNREDSCQGWASLVSGVGQELKRV